MFATYYAKDPLTGLRLHSILFHETKREMIEVSKSLGLRVSTRLHTPDYALRLADEMLDHPQTLLTHLDATELAILRRILAAGDGKYTPVSQRPSPYKLQELGLTVTYCDDPNNIWWLLMPKELRERLGKTLEKR